MIIEYGKKYICEDASVVGPLIASSDNYYIFECPETHRHFSMDGKCSLGDMPLMQPTTRYDIVKEYREEIIQSSPKPTDSDLLRIRIELEAADYEITKSPQWSAGNPDTPPVKESLTTGPQADTPKDAASDVCIWKETDSDNDVWTSDCGNDFVFTCGTPTNNEMKFCCHCGKPIKEQG